MTQRVLIPYEVFDLYCRDISAVGRPAWCFVIDKDWGSGQEVQIFLRCPNCCIPSHLFGHTVSRNGVVNASIWCQCPGSLKDEMKEKDWHVYGTLDRWEESIGIPKEASQDLSLLKTNLNPVLPEKLNG